jgi:hypothetical protein
MPTERQGLTALLTVTFWATLVFLVVILTAFHDTVEVHEIAGAVLLGLLVAAMVWARRFRTTEPRLMRRLEVALFALIVAAAIGGSLAAGALTGLFAGLPLVPLVVLLIALADGIRVLRRPLVEDAPVRAFRDA